MVCFCFFLEEYPPENYFFLRKKRKENQPPLSKATDTVAVCPLEAGWVPMGRGGHSGSAGAWQPGAPHLQPHVTQHLQELDARCLKIMMFQIATSLLIFFLACSFSFIH